MERGCWPKEDHDHRYIDNRIQHRVRQLKEACHLSQEDCKDMAQEFRLDLLLRLPAFDRKKAQRRTYIARLIEHHAHTLVKARFAVKRDPHREAGSLDTPMDITKPESDLRQNYLDEDTYYRGLRGTSPVEDRHDLTLSLSMMLNWMPDPLRQVCWLLYEGYTVTDIARTLNLHRSTVHERKAEIRRRLRSAGFGL